MQVFSPSTREAEAAGCSRVNGGMELYPPLPLCSCVKGSRLAGLATGLALQPWKVGVKGTVLSPVSRESHHTEVSNASHNLTQ